MNVTHLRKSLALCVVSETRSQKLVSNEEIEGYSLIILEDFIDELGELESSPI